MESTKHRLSWAFFRDVWRLVSPYREHMRKAMALIVVMQLLALVEPYLVMRIIDDIVMHGAAAKPRVLPLAGAAFVLLLLTTTVKILKDRQARVVATSIIADLPVLSMNKLLRLPLSYHQSEHVGEILTAVHNGTSRVQELVWMMLYDVLPVLIQTLVVSGAIAYLHWSIGLIVLCTIVSFFVVLVRVKNRWARHRKERHEMLRKADRLFSQAVMNVMTVQMFSREAVEVARVREARDQHSRMFYTEAASYDASGFTRNALVNFSRIGIIAWCAYLVFGGHMSIAKIVFASMLTERLFNACFTIGGIYDRLIDTVEPVRVMMTMLREVESVADPKEPLAAPQGAVEIRLDALTYAYPRQQTDPALNDVTLTLPTGKMVGIVGESGHGKSTLAKLLLRADDPLTGSVLFNGHALAAYRKSDVRSLIGYVPQEVELFDDTIAANIRYGCPEATDEEVERAARLAHAHGFISELEDGYRSLIGSRGLRLSGGQRQRIGIARAIIKNPSILIFDEATSSVDPETIAEIKRAMAELRRDRTMIVITHQISTIQDANMIVVLKKGRVHGVPGTHAELLKANDVYRGFVRRQQSADAGSHVIMSPSLS